MVFLGAVECAREMSAHGMGAAVRTGLTYVNRSALRVIRQSLMHVKTPCAAVAYIGLPGFRNDH